MKKISLALWLLSAIVNFGSQASDVSAQDKGTLTNESVIEMVKAGVPEEKILTVIGASKNKFDTSAAGLKALAIAGVPGPVIAAMEKRGPKGPIYGPAPTDTGHRVPDAENRPCVNCARYRVIATGFRVTSGTIDGHLLTDGRGDEVYITVNVIELGSDDRVIRPPSHKRSVNYGDTSGTSQPVRFLSLSLDHPVNRIVRAGSASPTTGGLLTGDIFPEFGQVSSEPQNVRTNEAGRFIPMILWEGALSANPNPSGVILFPTIWENDNIADVWDIWNTQASNWLRSYAARSSRDVMGAPTARTALLQVESDVMTTVPQINNFDRPVGMDGGPYDPVAANPDPARFSPQSLFLTAATAEAAVARGVIEVRYRDGSRYGPGDYTLLLRVERVRQ